MFIGVIFGILFEVIFWVVFVSIIVRVVKAAKRRSGSNNHQPPFQNSKPKDEPQCLNEDIHTDNFHTYCDYCGASVDRSAKKCSSCGARINK
ncbi:MAG: hypothetical protein J6Q13_02915 [Clostridia bacterium]|nr:hypothetical protein [Clostridia bacterium]